MRYTSGVPSSSTCGASGFRFVGAPDEGCASEDRPANGFPLGFAFRAGAEAGAGLLFAMTLPVDTLEPLPPPAQILQGQPAALP